MKYKQNAQCSLEAMQFYWRLKPTLSTANIVPDYLPFTLSYEPKYNLITQKRSKQLLDFLSAVYIQEPNIGNIQPGSIWNDIYKKDFLDFIHTYTKKDTHIKNILEIGCGGCLVLKELQEEGFSVLGIDPSSFSYDIGKKMNISVIQDFFPSSQIKSKFDMIFHSDVIEHIDKPLTFLKHIYDQLNTDGYMVLAIPDNQLNIANGDISIFLHQHLNYFDPESLELLVQEAGFSSIEIQPATFGGSLYCKAQKKIHIKKKIKKSSIQTEKLNEYIKRIDKLCSAMYKDILPIISDTNRSLGFYAPIRTVPYLAYWNLYTNFRFFDDTVSWHKKYLDGIPVEIENFEDLKKHPVTDIFIMSPTFGKKIKKNIKDYFSNSIHTYLLTDYFSI